MSERSESGAVPLIHREAQGTGAQRRLALWRRVSLVTFFERAKKVTPLRRRGNDPPGIARRYQCVGARPYNHPFCRAIRYASIRLATPSLPMHSDR